MSDSVLASGRCLEDLEPGMVGRHTVGRTVTSTDNTWFTLLTVDINAIHFDVCYSTQTEFGKPLVNSTFPLALITALSVSDVSRYAINLSWTRCGCRHWCSRVTRSTRGRKY